MDIAFITRDPRPRELEQFSKYLASYRDGSGNNREVDGSSRADARQIERCFAELLTGTTTENKAYYDFVIESNEDGLIAVRGASIKSKEIKSLSDYKDMLKRPRMRSHLEISNSFSRDWELCRKYGLSENDFRQGRYPEKFGEVILMRQALDRINSEHAYVSAVGNSLKRFVSRDSVYISILYSGMDSRGERNWLVSSFSVDLPKPDRWISRGKSIVGLDDGDEKLYEWYALGGSQFKYYPLLANRLYGTDLFEIPAPAIESLKAKANRLFGI